MESMRNRLLPPRVAAVPTLTPEQTSAARGWSGVRVAVGGPGTGKSVVVAAAAAQRVRAGSSLDRVVVLAQSRAAAQTLRRQISRQLPGAQTADYVARHRISTPAVARQTPAGPRHLQVPRA